MIHSFARAQVGVFLGGLVLIPAAMAGSITLQGTSSNSCNFTTMTGGADGVFTAQCQSTPSTTAIFTVLANGLGSASVVKGVALPISVTRTGSGLGVDNDVTFTPPSGATLAGGAATSKVSFLDSEVAGTNKSLGSVTFSTASPTPISLSLSNMPSGATLQSAAVTVTEPSTSGCTNSITFKDIGIMPAGGGVKYDITAPMALRFRISTGDSVGQRYYIQYEESVPISAYDVIDTTVSTCAGDFSAAGMTGTKANCIISGSKSGPALSVSATSACRVEPGLDYYINIKPSNGRSAFVFMLV